MQQPNNGESTGDVCSYDWPFIRDNRHLRGATIHSCEWRRFHCLPHNLAQNHRISGLLWCRHIMDRVYSQRPRNINGRRASGSREARLLLGNCHCHSWVQDRYSIIRGICHFALCKRYPYPRWYCLSRSKLEPRWCTLHLRMGFDDCFQFRNRLWFLYMVCAWPGDECSTFK